MGTDGTDGTDGRTDARTHGRTDGRTQPILKSPSWRGTKNQSGRGPGQIVTPVQAEIERAKALVKKRPSVKQKGKGTKRKATSSKSTTKKKKTDNYGPPGSGTTTEFWKRREKLDEMMNSDTKNVKK